MKSLLVHEFKVLYAYSAIISKRFMEKHVREKNLERTVGANPDKTSAVGDIGEYIPVLVETGRIKLNYLDLFLPLSWA